MDLPQWLQENSPPVEKKEELEKYRGPIKKKHAFLEKTLHEIINFFAVSVFAEEIAHRQGLLQSLNPKAKVLSLFLLLLAVNSVHQLLLIWSVYLGLVILALASRVPLLPFIKQVWLVIPLFTGIMASPALFNWVLPGDPLLMLWDFRRSLTLGPLTFPSTLAITKQGINSFILILSRVGVSVSIAALMTLTTPWIDLLRTFRSFQVPKIFVAGIEMTYRYLYVLITLVQDILIARKARDTGRSKVKEQRQFLARSIGTLFSKSLYMTEEIHSSMLARGYTGEIRSLKTFPWRWQDLLGLALVIMTSLTLYAADKVIGG